MESLGDIHKFAVRRIMTADNSLGQDLACNNVNTNCNPAPTLSPPPPMRGFTSEVTGAIVEFVVTQIWGAITGITRGLVNVVSREYTRYSTARASIPIVTVHRRWYVVTVGIVPGVYNDLALATKNAVGVPGGTYKKHPTQAAAEEAFKFALANDAVKSVRPKTVRTPPPPPPPSVTEDEGDDGSEFDAPVQPTNSSHTVSTSLPDARASPASSVFASCPDGITEPIEIESEEDSEEEYGESEGYSEYAPSMRSDVDFYIEGGRFITRH
ncbi:hypothetical protein BD410DRAFT_846799 [Rickenella mellea]|uniref:Ribonuclease H1 N-terminal domain-containing protein n=1 Tax=Rickenella mellea TaxID=50990 RepID=A0A4Y7PGE9_9AGAM|nr:hypothetical protein BD410DRAFT_846799 [Rickenella mellea]